MTRAQLQQMQAVVPAKTERVDISGVQLDMDVPAAMRAEHYLQQIGNPYAFRCGDIAVNVRFCPGGKTLAQAMQTYLAAKAGL